jgi:hypothetical protein
MRSFPIRGARSLAVAAALLALAGGCAFNEGRSAGARPFESGFSFAVYGDSRSMMVSVR